MLIDLRSDTVTRPTPGMLDAMMQAPVGDDVFGEDPSLNRLEAITAELFGMEAALFCPSGTQTNQVAIHCHTRPGDEIICDALSHIYQYEGGGMAFNSGCQPKLIQGNRGRINAKQVEESINPQHDYKAFSRLVSLENTTNRGGGACYQLNDIQEIKLVCRKNNLRLHLDGARLWNALIAKNEKAGQYGAIFDSISVCLSKGLGAPAGSLLVGSKDFIRQARRIRKIMGGGMRQAGYLAAAGIYALENHVNRLEEDHRHAQAIAEILSEKNWIESILPAETNLLVFSIQPPYTPQAFADYLAQREILCFPISATEVRMVTHLDVTPVMIDRLREILKSMW